MNFSRMELICSEKMTDCNFAKRDSVIFEDIRVLRNLLATEHFYIPHCNYFAEIQHDIQPFMRKVVATWMLEVCEEQLCEDQVFPLAINFMDRFLCQCAISRQQLQLLGATSLLLASKIRQCHSLTVDLLCAYTDHSVTPEAMKDFEILVLSKLQWNVAGVTGFDYVDHIIERINWCRENNLIRRHAHTLVAICYTEPEFIQTPPSLIAAACICASAHGLKARSAETAAHDISALTACNPTTIQLLFRHIEKIVDKEVANLSTKENSKEVNYTNNELLDNPKYGQPETPADIQDIDF